MDAHGPIDPDLLDRMRQSIGTAIATRRSGVAEAAAEVRGFARGRCPVLSAGTIDGAVAGILREFDARRAGEPPVERDGAVLVPAAPEEVADALAYAMRFDERGRARRTGVEYAARLAADQLVRHLLLGNFAVLRRQPPRS